MLFCCSVVLRRRLSPNLINVKPVPHTVYCMTVLRYSAKTPPNALQAVWFWCVFLTLWITPAPSAAVESFSWFTSNALERGIEIVVLEEGVDWEGTEPKQKWHFFCSGEGDSGGRQGVTGRKSEKDQCSGRGRRDGRESERENCTWKGEWMAWSER